LYETNPSAVKSEIATFLEVFPGGTIWSNDVEGRGYDVVLLGRAEPTKIDVDKLNQRLSRDDHSFVRESLSEVGLKSADELLGTYAGRRAELNSWLQDAQINRDGNLRLQYLAGMGLNSYQSEQILDAILACRKYPNDSFLFPDDADPHRSEVSAPSSPKE
jgi:spermidine synthase